MTPFRWDRLSGDQARVLRIVEQHRGRGNAIPLPEVSRRTGIPMRQLQTVVKAMVEELCIPIGTSSSSSKPGWYLCETREDLDYNREHFTKRGASMMDRARAFDPTRHPELAELYAGQRSLLGLREGDQVRHRLTGERFTVRSLVFEQGGVRVVDQGGRLHVVPHTQVTLVESAEVADA